jgi:hypothetical protein
VDAAVPHVHAVDDAITKRSAALDDAPAHAANVGLQSRPPTCVCPSGRPGHEMDGLPGSQSVECAG